MAAVKDRVSLVSLSEIPGTLRGVRAYIGLRMIPVGMIAEEYGCVPAYVSRVLRERQRSSRVVFEKLRAAVARASKKRCAGRSTSSRRRDTGVE